jgi:hypothetical protein
MLFFSNHSKSYTVFIEEDWWKWWFDDCFNRSVKIVTACILRYKKSELMNLKPRLNWSYWIIPFLSWPGKSFERNSFKATKISVNLYFDKFLILF